MSSSIVTELLTNFCMLLNSCFFVYVCVCVCVCVCVRRGRPRTRLYALSTSVLLSPLHYLECGYYDQKGVDVSSFTNFLFYRISAIHDQFDQELQTFSNFINRAAGEEHK